MSGNIYELRPLESVSPVRFGMTPDQVRGVMSEAPFVFRKMPESGDVYAYHHHDFQVFFDAAQTVEFIELSRSVHMRARYAELDVLNTPADQVIEHLSRLANYDRDAPEQGYTYIFPTLELALWRPVVPTRQAVSEGRYFSTVGLGRQGYYSAK